MTTQPDRFALFGGLRERVHDDTYEKGDWRRLWRKRRRASEFVVVRVSRDERGRFVKRRTT